MADTKQPRELKGGTHVELDEAKIKSVAFKDGQAVVTITADVTKLKATRKELDKLSHSDFQAFVVIEGNVVQTELDFSENPEVDDGTDEPG